MSLGIREATSADWPSIWPFFRDTVTAGETLKWLTDSSLDDLQAHGNPAIQYEHASTISSICQTPSPPATIYPRSNKQRLRQSFLEGVMINA